MKINKTDKIMQIYNNMSANKVNSNKNRFEKDEIKLSERAKDYQFAMIKLKEIPDMRMDKVNKLKDLVQSGNYNVEGKKIVEKMYENINFDERI
ncbi:flagellar biosynthesis anti-sigma factor FlgM [Clostridium sp. Cult3]|jgi:negative regulator of flagellin synthesis FlgM|uniref:flagellar biosynthesis anti-sigma factor FlgM n=1 Tax=Clostridium sp. Cult3 TaxID=2079004 RepID=UPI001F01D0D1|nr:flagellar biosynthesis anti-sigma factor FlgM [Clostridium sp. Cult3]